MKPNSDHLKAKVERGESGDVAVALEGELDLGSVDVFAAAMDDALGHGAGTVVLDWGGLSFIDSSGVGAYVQAYRKARAAGVTLALGARSDVVQRVLDLSGVEEALTRE